MLMEEWMEGRWGTLSALGAARITTDVSNTEVSEMGCE